jgi:hypothetical protein
MDVLSDQQRPQILDSIEVGREKRNLSLGESRWSGLTFNHILLPLWTGEYRFQGKIYSIMINGQTGEATGEKPRDAVKIVFICMIGLLFVILINFLFLLFGGTSPLL